MEHYIRSSILLIIYYELNNNDYILKHIYPTLYNPQKIKISVGDYVKVSVKFGLRCQVSLHDFLSNLVLVHLAPVFNATRGYWIDTIYLTLT